ncbi:Uma2 family endonuclease [Benzoatithermus flavus]|uniref:Uma2 family endonuclease n=1 Tax=Benzoatithermus flavus TaxID=3108223 RepID=A0ABU8XXX1_9PROT
MKAVRDTHRWTVDGYHRMAEVGLLSADDRVGPIDGVVVEMSPIGSLHARTVRAITRLLDGSAATRATIAVHDIRLRLDAHNEPQPDVMLLRPSPDGYATAHPGPGDVLLLIEVADSTVPKDRRDELSRYAAAGVPEVCPVDLPAETVEVHRDPRGSRYCSVRYATRGDEVEPEALPGLRLPVADMLP